jgi:hypothetical protein
VKDLIKNWLLQRRRVPGILAYGVRFPDKTALSESFAREFPAPALENVWRCLSDTYQVLGLHRIPAIRMQWSYQNGALWSSRRNDGIILGLFTAKKPTDADHQGIEQLFAEFHALRPGTRRTSDPESTGST